MLSEQMKALLTDHRELTAERNRNGNSDAIQQAIDAKTEEIRRLQESENTHAEIVQETLGIYAEGQESVEEVLSPAR